MGKIPIPPERFNTYKGTRQFKNSRQCAAVYHRGTERERRCNWFAKADSLYCRKHGGNEGNIMGAEHKEAMAAGRANWWERLHRLEKQYPGIIREIFRVDETKARQERKREIERTTMRRPKTKDPLVLKAHKALVTVAADQPEVPDKPFEELQPHEQMVVITGQSLQQVHTILKFKITQDSDPKMLSLVKDTALRALATRIKADRNALQARRVDKISELIARLTNKQPGDDAKVIEATAQPARKAGS